MSTALQVYELFMLSYESLLVLMLSAVTCALIGSFLVLRKLSMVSDAISHTVLLGIVLAFFATSDVSSPLLIIGAAFFGVITVFCIEMLSDTGLVKNDEAVGIIFPLFFSLAVILITKYARNAHLDTDIVLMGEVILAPLNRIEIFGYSLPKALVQMCAVFLINLSFIILFFKELKLTTFDKEYASIIGISSTALFYLLMSLSSLTAVVAFDAVGAILVVSFLITPGAAAYLICKDLKIMLFTSALYALINSLIGYTVAMLFNLSMSGATATVAGCTFFLTFLFHREGLLTAIWLRHKKRKEFRLELVILHIGNHLGENNERDELGLESIDSHLMWERAELEKRTKILITREFLYIDQEKNIYALTEKGRQKYEEIKVAYGL